MRTLRAFTLIEFMMAILISSIIGIAAVSAGTRITSDLMRNERIVMSYDRAKTLMDFMVTRAQEAGGGGLRPWHTIQVVNNASASPPTIEPPGDLKPGTDMLVLLEEDGTLPQCPITNRPGASANLDSGGTPCCLTAAYENRVLTIVTPQGEAWGSAASNNFSAGPCRINFPPGASGGGAELDKMPGDQTDFDNGFIIATTVVRFYVNTNNQLIMQTDPNTADATVTFNSFVVASGVFDMQLALGYDADGDGDIAETGGTNDEWLYNAAGDALGVGGLAGTAEEKLRMLLIGVSVSTPDRDTNGVSQLLDGPSLTSTGNIIRSTTSRAYLRNLSIFL